MMKKSDKTKAHILEKVRPIFNKYGYASTSMADITKATGLTKGAIYGNFKNKESLAVAAFNYNVSFITSKISNITKNINSPIAKLYGITNFYRDLYIHDIGFDGCPILNAGVDSNHNNKELYNNVHRIFTNLKKGISKIIQEGQQLGEIKKSIDAKLYGGRILSQIEGAVFTTTMLKDHLYLIDMMNHLDEMIKTQLQTNK